MTFPVQPSLSPTGAEPAPAPQPAAPVTPPSPTPQPAAGSTPNFSAGAPAPTPAQDGAGVPSVRDLLQQRGWDASSFASDDDFFSYLDNLHQRLPAYEQLAAYGQRVMPYAQQFEEFLKSQQQPAPQGGAAIAAPQPEESYWAKPPEWNPQWEEYLTLDASGKVVLKDPFVTSPAIIEKYHAYQNWRRQSLDNLIRDPVDAIWKGIEKRLEARERERGFLTAADVERQRHEAYANQFTAANQDWLWVHDAQGNVVRNEHGQPLPTEAGMAFTFFLQQAAEDGVADPVKQTERAMKDLQLWALQRQQAAQPTGNPPSQPPAQPAPGQPPTADPAQAMKDRFLAGTHAPQRDGSFAAAAHPHVPQNPDLSYSAMLRQNATLRGIPML